MPLRASAAASCPALVAGIHVLPRNNDMAGASPRPGMIMAMDQSERPFVLHALRHRVAVIEAQGAGRPTERALALGVATLDRALGGGLALGALHEIAPAAPLDFGAAASFALALLARASATDGRAVLWIEPEAAEFEAGHLHGPGLELLGLPMARLIGLSAPHERDGAWAMEEALRCRAVAGVVGEFARKSSLDLTMLRRLSLAAGEGGGLGLLLRHRPCALPSPAITRCEIAAAPGARDAFGGLGRPAFSLSLFRNRRGPTGRWLLSWDHHEHAFLSAPSSLDLATAAADRPSRAARIRAG